MRRQLLAAGALVLASLSLVPPPAEATCAVQQGPTQAGCVYQPEGDCAAGAMQPNGCAAGVAPVSDQQWTYLGCP
ncbi:MAG TPA: hypothetical protein VM241_04965 [Candidatus Thermoplasmatota archaeon]|nr:hypothetical protein [Candidatus Thermoplasmatota archaeon]